MKKEYIEVLEEFQKIYGKYEQEEKERKANGEHYYNIFRELYGARNEVRVHSRFLGSLLNVDNNRSHCQDDLFLKEFISVCELENFGLNTKNAEVIKEYKNIDIYITDGKKHIIIENKIDADDQPQQLLRYIKTIYDEIKGKNKQDISAQDILDNIYVIYLSPDGRVPNKISLKKDSYGFEIKGDELVSVFDEGNSKKDLKDVVFKLKKVKVIDEVNVKFKCISYKKEILNLVKNIKAKEEVKKLRDFEAIISQYEKVVDEVINGEPELVNKDIVEFIAKNFEICYKLANNHNDEYKKECEEMAKSLNYAKQFLINDFFTKHMYEKLENLLKDNEKWELTEYKPLKRTDRDNVICINPKTSSRYFVRYVIQPLHYIKDVRFGSQKNHSALSNIKELIEENNIDIKEKTHRDEWLVFADYLYDSKNKDEFALYLFKNKDSLEKIAEDYCNKVMTTINKLDDGIEKINKELAKEKIADE